MTIMMYKTHKPTTQGHYRGLINQTRQGMNQPDQKRTALEMAGFNFKDVRPKSRVSAVNNTGGIDTTTG